MFPFLKSLADMWNISTKRPAFYEYNITGLECIWSKGKYTTFVKYRPIGSRTEQKESAYNLNRKMEFYRFKPSCAQLIVSIATIESMMKYSEEELVERYKDYVKECHKYISTAKKT